MSETPWAEPTKDEASLLLYCEARAVDGGGRLDTRNLNTADLTMLDDWREREFVFSGRIRSADVKNNESMWVTLSDAAWSEAGELRKARAKRIWEKRGFQTTEGERASS